MITFSKKTLYPSLFIIGIFSWLIPGGGYFLLKEKKRATIIFIAIVATFLLGIYVGSIGVVDPIGSRAWYVAQAMNSPLVFILGTRTAAGGFEVYGKPNEIGQIYTSITGLLNLLCIVNAVYLAHIKISNGGGEK